MKIMDLNSIFYHRVDRRMPIGIWIENIWARANNGDESAIETLKVYIATMWSVFSVAPDDQYISDLYLAAEDALKRHPDWYGIKEGSEEEDAKAVQEVKEMKEFEEDIKKMDDAEQPSTASE